MAEVVTAVAWEECDAIAMVTIVLLVIWVCGTVPECKQDRLFNTHLKNLNIWFHETGKWQTWTHKSQHLSWWWRVRCLWQQSAPQWLQPRVWRGWRLASVGNRYKNHLVYFMAWIDFSVFPKAVCVHNGIVLTVCIYLCHGVCGLCFLSPDCRVRWQCDPCRRVPRCLRPLNANSGWRRVNSQTWTPERTYSCVKNFI